MSQYAGSDWVKLSLKKEMSPLGEEVADVLGAVFAGIYHIRRAAITTDWSNKFWIQVVINRGLNSFDDNYLTALVVLCHDRMLRVQVDPCTFTHLKLTFHKRNFRLGGIFQRMPTIEDHVEEIREAAGLECLLTGDKK